MLVVFHHCQLSRSQMDTPLIALKSHELHHLSVKFGAIGSVMEYMGSTLKAMHEAWEDLLSMMDSKLASYAKVHTHFSCHVV